VGNDGAAKSKVADVADMGASKDKMLERDSKIRTTSVSSGNRWCRSVVVSWERDGAGSRREPGVGDGAERRDVGWRENTLYSSVLNNNHHHRSSGSEVTDAKRETERNPYFSVATLYHLASSLPFRAQGYVIYKID